jgi:hypothetical protein
MQWDNHGGLGRSSIPHEQYGDKNEGYDNNQSGMDKSQTRDERHNEGFKKRFRTAN